MLNKTLFTNKINELATIFNTQLSKERINLYYKYLNKYNDLDFNTAVNTIIQYDHKFPSIATLRTLAKKEN